LALAKRKPLSSKPLQPKPLLKTRLAHIVLHPFLLAAVSVLSARLQVKLEVLPEEVVAPLILMEAWAAIVFLLLWLTLKNPLKAGIASSFIVGLNLCFDQFRLYLNLASQILFHVPVEDIITFILFFLILGGLLYLLLRTPRQKEGAEAPKPVDFGRMNVAFNLMCTILLLMNLVPLMVSDSEAAKTHAHFIYICSGPCKSFSATADSATKPADKPDVYYIILDAYASPYTLQKQGNFDDHDFLEYLKGHGFYVVPKAASNYDRTPFSISSSLNMDYISAVPKEMGDNYQSDNIYYRLMQDSAVACIFKKLGYKFVNVSSGAFATDNIPKADYNIKADFGSHFTTAMMMLTPLTGLEKYLHIMRDGYCDRRAAPGKCLDQVLAIKGPKFVLIHTDLSHPPAIFDKDGKRKDLPRELLNDHSTDFNAYVEQIKYCNSEVQKWIEKIDTGSGAKPVIIIQADHGTYYPMKDDDSYYNEVMRILNAYRFPGDLKPSYYPTITPVNTFRVLFNDYFGAHFPLLKDQSWCSPVRVRPYSWSDVTPKLVFPVAEGAETPRQEIK